MTITSNSEANTIKAAQDLATTLKKPTILCLYGDLGMGKSVFARALIRALCNDETLEVPSPTFTLVQTYEDCEIPIHHYDLYRIKKPEEIFELGWEESCANAITIVEWPERLGAYKPLETLDITITKSENSNNHREIQISDV